MRLPAQADQVRLISGEVWRWRIPPWLCGVCKQAGRCPPLNT